ncbi:hypothetical protein GCM10009530_63490 [Microbispora corallina]|uniref:Uncharacterized protein n=1 Tax=Microbispora corallina TaxID=83302 RepID=A0ABQ4GBN7_9ACTN|nr:hypothetical protein [Microbispora corallina]GIH44421.1 hypothetical protein Mco01_74210 [Microbispora corallina]
MPILPAAVVAILTELAAATAVTGSAADLVSLGFTISDHMRGQDGLQWDTYIFKMDTPASDPDDLSPSASARTKRGTGGKSAATPQARKPSLLTADPTWAVPILEIRADTAIAKFVLERYLVDYPDGGTTQIWIARLDNLDGFDSGAGTQAEVAFTGVEVEHGHLLNMRGWVNKWLGPFFHFSLTIFIRAMPVSTLDNPVIPIKSEDVLSAVADITKTSNGFLIKC